MSVFWLQRPLNCISFRIWFKFKCNRKTQCRRNHKRKIWWWKIRICSFYPRSRELGSFTTTMICIFLASERMDLKERQSKTNDNKERDDRRWIFCRRISKQVPKTQWDHFRDDTTPISFTGTVSGKKNAFSLSLLLFWVGFVLY